jgi:hypothetical protein
MNYKKESLGRMAEFLLPSLKLKSRGANGEMLEEKLHKFLLANFSAYTAQAGNIFGYWKDAHGHDHYGEHKLYKVSFEGVDRIPLLESFLGEMSAEMQEECVYFETGEDAWLIYPEKV